MARHSVGISVAFVQLLFWCDVYIYTNSWSIQLPLSYLLWPIKRKQRFKRKIAFLTYRKMFPRRLFTVTVIIVLGKDCPHRRNVILDYIPSLIPSGLCRKLPPSVVWPQRMLLLQLRLHPQLHRGPGVLSEGEGLFTNDVGIFRGLWLPLVLMSAYYQLLACPLVLHIDDVICEQPWTKNYHL